jgi:folylpolyglutamate synthase
VFVLGDTVEKIAWHKAGIMKNGSKAFTVEQAEGAQEVLRKRAEEKGVDLRVVGVDERLEGVRIRPDAVFQRRNASLAVRLAETVMKRLDGAFELGEKGPLPREFVEGLEQVVWRGRCEVKEEEGVTWYVDGAHTVDSLKMAARWFVGECAGKKGPKVLIFNQQGRSEAVDFLDGLCNTVKKADPVGKGFEHVIFCTNVTYAETGYKRGMFPRKTCEKLNPVADYVPRLCQPPIQPQGHRKDDGAKGFCREVGCPRPERQHHAHPQHRGGHQQGPEFV